MAIRYIAHLQSVLATTDNEPNPSNNTLTPPSSIYYPQNDSSCTRLWRLTVIISQIYICNNNKNKFYLLLFAN